MLMAMVASKRSPFPGIDPWLEHPGWWPNVHQSLITYARDRLQADIGDRYFVSIGERIYVEPAGQDWYPDVHVTPVPAAGRTVNGSGAEGADRPIVLAVSDVEHREVFLEILDAASGRAVVTVIEVLSPANKRPGSGRELYLRKQRDLLASNASLVEIDLLRAGEPTVAVPAHQQAGDYRVAVARARQRTQRELYPISLRERLPRVAIPLAPTDPDVVLDLQALLEETYEKSGLWRRIDNALPPVPALADRDQAWAGGILAKAR
jgi:hypothetical protein